MGKDDGSELPIDPVTALLEGAASLHELFKAWTEAGFTEWQACRIMGVMIAESGRQS